ncbi:GntR family transcriptional regulator [Psychrobacter sp. DAB_AL43B]|uniref:GntR family transcriptional regulator n=1 Tax=Psychrobacter sp. DAB_AL43B TaxID=1028416 RepID=UPI0009A57D9A|nr:GntR family transcriptional regulator [Psychrobacter sp. DAB_AL43B]SLJ85270.1 transcriptional regulator, GntR family [Psychrobacter sp. DAB_AL43B]
MIENFKNFKMPRYEQVRWHIQTLLTESKWDENTPLPTEQEFADKYQVSVGTVRKAVEKLVEEGVLIKQQGKGTFLKRPDFESSLLRFFKFRDKESSYVTPTGIVKKIMVIEAIDDINQKLNLGKNKALIYIERIRIVDDKVLLSERIWLPKSRYQAFVTLAPEDFENFLYPFYYKKCGQFVSSAVETLFFITDHSDPYLDNTKQENLVKVCRIARNLEGDTPLSTSKGIEKRRASH